MSAASDALGTAMDAAILALSSTDKAVALKCWQAIALPLLNPGAVGVASPTPAWIKVTKAYTDFSAAATNNNITIYTLPAGGVIHAVKTKHSVSFAGGLIATYTISTGIAGNLSKYAVSFDIFQATGALVYQLSTTVSGESQSATTAIKAEAISTGANLNAATGGTVDIWLLVSVAA